MKVRAGSAIAQGLARLAIPKPNHSGGQCKVPVWRFGIRAVSEPIHDADFCLLPAGNATHVGQAVRDALVAIDARLLTRKQEALVGDRGARRLLGDVHGLRTVAIAAFQRIIGLEARPFVQRQFKPLVDEFFAGVDEAEKMAPDLLGGLHLARDFVRPVVRNVTIRASGPDPGAIGKVDRRSQFLKHVIVHLVAARAKFFGVGQFECRVEGAPEDHACGKAREHQNAEPEHRARADQYDPEFAEKSPGPPPKGWARALFFEHTHRRPPGAARLSMVSTSTKSLLTGGLVTFWGT